MVIEQGKADLAALQHVHGFVECAGNDAHLRRLQHAAVARQPVSHDGTRQGTPRGQRDHMGLPTGHGLQLVMRLGQGAHHLLGGVAKGFTGRGEANRPAARFDQRRSSPCLQRTNAPAKRRMGDMAQLCRTGEAALLSQKQKVFQPFALHGQSLPWLSSGLQPAAWRAWRWRLRVQPWQSHRPALRTEWRARS